MDYLNPIICDQMSMRRFVDELIVMRTPDGEWSTRLGVLVLPRVEFANGSIYFNAKLPQRLCVTPSIIHNNCIIGHDSKVRRFQEYGLWFVRADNTHQPNDADASQSTRRRCCYELCGQLSGHRELVTSVATMHVDFDGVKARRVIVTASYDKTLRLWDFDSLRCLHIAYVHKRGGPWAIRATGETNVLFTGSHDRTACALRWRDDDQQWHVEQTFHGHSSPITAICVDRDLLATASEDCTARSWLIESATTQRVFVGHTAMLSDVLIDGGALFTASMDRTVRAWQLSTGRCMQLYQGHTEWVRCLALAPRNNNSKGDDALIYSGSSDSTVRVWHQRVSFCFKKIRKYTN